MIPGEYVYADGPIVCNEGYEAVELEVVNRGNRPVQVGSHFHFYEANDALEFDRAAAWGRRLDVAAGTAVRFEAGQRLTVCLVEMGGRRRVFGFNGKVNGYLDGEKAGEKAGEK
jgi:urease subunit beta